MNEIVYDFSKEKATNGQHVQYAQDSLAEVPEEMATKYGFSLQYNAFRLATNNEVAGYKPNLGFLNTVKMEDTDKGRDDVFKLYRFLVKAHAEYDWDADRKEAGRTLFFAFEETGDATRMDYDSETAALNDLVSTLRTEPYAAALTTLGLEEAPDKIEEKNQEFQTVYRERKRTEREKTIATDMKLLRAATDDAFDNLAKAVNALFAVNEMVTKDETTRTELGELIDNVNDVVYRFRKVIGSNSGTSGDGGETPTPEPVTPEITEVYSKVEDPHDPTGITRGKETIMKWVGDFELVNETGDGPGKIIVKDNFTGVEEEVPVEDILSRSNTGCEFIMIRDFAEGEYKIRIETYVDGSLLTLEYGKLIKLV